MSIGFGQLGFDIGAFVENEPCALLQRLGKKIQYAVERRHGSGGDDVRLLEERSRFGALRYDTHVCELERFDGGIYKTRFLLSGLGEREANIRQHDGKWNAGEAGAGAGVEDSLGIRKMTPGSDRVAHVLYGGFFRIREPREVHVLVGGNDQIEMLGSFRDQALAIWNFRRKNAIQFFDKRHTFIMTLRVTRR